ncbi:MAG: hypothetical protein COX07_00400, partial [Bacteroidetes bacterium CG23_combo_of_CG06-09_8_20_14_all_32_9]
MQEIEEMYASVKFFPYDNYALWNENNVGFGWVQLYDTPESVYDKQPRDFGNSNYTIVGKARLDNRIELCDIFKISADERTTFPDTKLLALAYEKWGNECTKKLFGDWSFAVWDRNEKQLFLARDHHGVTSIYYTVNENFIAFASNINVLLSISNVSHEINKVQIAQLLVGWHGYAEETAYKNIYRIPPAHRAVYKKGKLSLSKYWWLEEVSDIRFKNDDDYVEAFNELFVSAVKSRLRSYRSVASMLSSGLDSTSVTALAAIELLKEGKNIKAYTSVPLFNTNGLLKPSQYGDESELASLVAKMYTNIEHILVKSENRNPLQGVLKSLQIHKTPIRNSSNLFWILSINELAKQNGAGTLLNGQAGNFTISWPFKGYYLNMIQPGIKPFLRKQTPYFLMRFWYDIKKGTKPFMQYSFINRQFATDINLPGRMNKAGYDPHFITKSSLRKTRMQVINVNMAQGASIAQENGDAFGINIYAPTIDIKLLEYCTAIPDEQFVKKGFDRYLIRRAMKNKLPDAVLQNQRKGLQSADLVLRIKENINDYEEIIKAISESEICRQLIDVQKLNDIYFQIKSTSDIKKLQSGSGFLRGI